MLRFGSVVLAAVLLGVPRALDARAFGAPGPRSVYVDVAPADPRLADFAAELKRAIDGASYVLVARPFDATLIVEVHGLWRWSAASGPTEAVSLTVRDAGTTRPVVLHYAPDRRSDAARALLAALPDRFRDGDPFCRFVAERTREEARWRTWSDGRS
jgi:hypothetical protein